MKNIQPETVSPFDKIVLSNICIAVSEVEKPKNEKEKNRKSDYRA
jgi:hypothetical protein